MTTQLREIGERLAGLRDVTGVSAGELAEHCGVTPEELGEYERGERDFSFSFLSNAAGKLGVDVVDIMSGDNPKLSSVCVTRSGGGYAVDRRAAYSYKHLAFTFRGRLAEPFLVTVEPRPDDANPELHAHEGQEYNFVAEGRMRFFIDNLTYELEAGDGVYFDSGRPHAMRAIGGPVKFLAVVMKGGSK